MSGFEDDLPRRSAQPMDRTATCCKHAAAMLLTVTAMAGTALWPGNGEATVFHARSELMKLAFPDADRTQARDFFLDGRQRAAIEELAHAPLDSDLVTVYEGRAGETLLGYAIVDTHLVRTLPETLLIVLTPEGALAATHVAAFHEPTEYLPQERWRKNLVGRRLSEDLRVGRGVAAITGATLSSRAVVASVRRALAIYAVLIGGER
jgi:hypothetical protein